MQAKEKKLESSNGMTYSFNGLLSFKNSPSLYTLK